MKRSEAETIINNFLDHSLVITGKTILDLVEKLGMLPPETQITKTVSGDVTSSCYVKVNYSLKVNKWESEDESR